MTMRFSIGLAAALLLSTSAVTTGALAADTATLEANKKTVVEFYEKGLNQKDFEAASKYFGPRYVQHNPTAPDGIEGFKKFISFLRGNSRTPIVRSRRSSRMATM